VIPWHRAQASSSHPIPEFDDRILAQAMVLRQFMVEHARSHQSGAGGSVVGHVEGAHIPEGIDVLISPIDEEYPTARRDDPFLITQTDANGAFRFDGLPPGQYRVGLRFRPGRDDLP